jgi:hypothetical protein
MIVQITLARNEKPLIEELLPLWRKYVDGFVFLIDKRTTDDTIKYLNKVKDKYNILEILETNPTGDGTQCPIETDYRQLLFDTAKKYSNKIICLDADEYLDGNLTKKELEDLLDDSPNTLYHLKWVQYTSCNTVRVDGPWGNNLKDRIGNYVGEHKFNFAQMHSTHLPVPSNQHAIPPEKLFIAHLQWLDKTYVAIKQYYWKVEDYVNNKLYGVEVAGNSAYDGSINDFNWKEEYTCNLLKINPNLISDIAINNNYRIPVIKSRTAEHNIPDLGDWGYNITSLDETNTISNNPHKISVITAIGPLDIYEHFVPRYIKSVKDQHFFNQTEHIIVYSEWSKYFNELKNLNNFKFIKENKRLGVYNAWNIGIKNSTTEYITNWNVDDLRHPINTKLKYDYLERNPDYSLAYNWYVATHDINEDFNNIDLDNKTYLRFPDNFHSIVLENCYAGPDPIWKKCLHDAVGYFDYKNFNTIGDWEMWIRFAKAGFKFKLIPEVLCIYLEHNQPVSQRQHSKLNEEKQRLGKKYYG